MKTISLKVDEGLFRWLEAEARRLGLKKSDIVREALDQQRNGRGKRTLHDIMKDVCGSIEGGPRDMATNKKYMEGFGRD